MWVCTCLKQENNRPITTREEKDWEEYQTKCRQSLASRADMNQTRPWRWSRQGQGIQGRGDQLCSASCMQGNGGGYYTWYHKHNAVELGEVTRCKMRLKVLESHSPAWVGRVLPSKHITSQGRIRGQDGAWRTCVHGKWQGLSLMRVFAHTHTHTYGDGEREREKIERERKREREREREKEREKEKKRVPQELGITAWLDDSKDGPVHDMRRHAEGNSLQDREPNRNQRELLEWLSNKLRVANA